MPFGNRRGALLQAFWCVALLSVCLTSVRADVGLAALPSVPNHGRLSEGVRAGFGVSNGPGLTASPVPPTQAGLLPYPYPPPAYTPTPSTHHLLPLVLKSHPSHPVPTTTPRPSPTRSPTDPPPTRMPTLTPLPSPTPTRAVDALEYGMHAFLWYHPEVASRDLQVIRDAGFGWVKQVFGWRDIEPSRGLFDWSHSDWIVDTCEEAGLKLLVRVDHQPEWAGGNYPTNGPPDNYHDLGDFLYAVATRYRGRIAAYEVWNEPNLASEWGGRRPRPMEYARLLFIAYPRIKQADPGALVISGGLAPTGTDSDLARPDDVFLDRLYHHMGGSSNGYFDLLGAHASGYKAPPETDPAEAAARADLGGHRCFCLRRVEDLRAIMVRHGEADKQIAVTEFGWTSDPRPGSPYHWHAVTEQQKADYLVRAYQYARSHWSPWIGPMSLIYIAKHEWTWNDEQYWWAITYPGWPEFYPRPAYDALKAMPK